MATVTENLERLAFAAGSPVPDMRLIELQSLAISMPRRELEKLVIVMTEGLINGADAARTLVKDVQW